MTQHLRDAWETVVPPKGAPHGKLPPLLLLLTIVTGLVDAFSYLTMGRVFVANMTGNVVFLSFALGGAPGFIWWASLLAIATFIAGALLGGLVRTRCATNSGMHLFVASTAQLLLVALALVVVLCVSTPAVDSSYSGLTLTVLIVLLGAAMGLQNATARALAVPDLTTTVLTLTLTGLSADSRAAGGGGSRLGRRILSVLTMFVGGLVGALLVRGGRGPTSLIVATVLLVIVAVGARRMARQLATA
jgi:uncharacterized membrane protein YoaK (UPF0700 family)